MKIISLDAPNVRMVSRPSDSGPSFELPLDLPPEIDQRDIDHEYRGRHSNGCIAAVRLDVLGRNTAENVVVELLEHEEPYLFE